MEIKHLKLFTENPEKLQRFYSETLGMDTRKDEDGFRIVLPNGSYIAFCKSEEPWYYHFAFNISENQIDGALTFVKSFANPLPDPDTGYPIIDFPAWNAHSVYFKDPAQNIVEFIARHDLDNAGGDTFDANSILEISEIGTPSADVLESFNLLHDNFGLDRYSGNFETFCATGDQHGLFILTQTERNWFPTSLKSIKAPYHIRFNTAVNGNAELSYADGQFHLVVP